jgi:ubiquinone/menaquinone biosynthesis C-methylase UbiE
LFPAEFGFDEAVPFLGGRTEPDPVAAAVVLEPGSGAGLDSLLTARTVGPTARSVGVDLCPKMVEQAAQTVLLLGLSNVEFKEAFCVLRPGGRLQMADILLHDNVTPEQVACLGE